MAGLDGVQNKIHPGDPIDKNLYDLPPEIAAKIPHPCASLDEALDHLDKDREFLTRGGVFSNDMIDGYIALKMEEVTRFRRPRIRSSSTCITAFNFVLGRVAGNGPPGSRLRAFCYTAAQ
jgi:glutamine synthetase